MKIVKQFADGHKSYMDFGTFSKAWPGSKLFQKSELIPSFFKNRIWIQAFSKTGSGFELFQKTRSGSEFLKAGFGSPSISPHHYFRDGGGSITTLELGQVLYIQKILVQFTWYTHYTQLDKTSWTLCTFMQAAFLSLLDILDYKDFAKPGVWIRSKAGRIRIFWKRWIQIRLFK